MIDKEQKGKGALPPGVSIRRLDDGNVELKFDKGTGVTPDSIAKVTGADFFYLDDKHKRAVAWVPGLVDQEHQARLKELDGLVTKIISHVESKEISGTAARDVAALIKWLGTDLKQQAQLHREQVVRMASMTEGVHRDARRKGAVAKREKDPVSRAKAVAKQGALDLWKERDAGQHPKLGTVTKFATEVMRRWPVLTSAKVIEGWSAKWTNDRRAGRDPAC